MLSAARLSVAASRHSLHVRHALLASAQPHAQPRCLLVNAAHALRLGQQPFRHRGANQHRCSSSTTNATNSTAPRTSSLSASHPKPRVVLISWLGARQQHFDKYAKLWQDMGHDDVVAIRPPMSCVLFPALGDVKAKELLLSLEDGLLQQPARPTVMHLLSGGGFIFTAALLQQLARQQQQPPSVSCPATALLQSIHGVVLDSSPSPITGDVAARAITAALLAETSTGVEGRHPVLVGALRGWLEAYLTLPPIQDRMSQVWGTWDGAVLPPLPTLLLYSEADPLVPPEFVEDWGAAQARRGAAVQYGKWQDSPHVEHYRMHPQEYRQRLEAFVASLEVPVEA